MLRVEEEGRLMEAEQMEKTDVRVKVTPANQISKGDSGEVMKLFEAGYGERWQGESNFTNSILSNSTELLRIYEGQNLAASLILDNDRISIIAVHPNSQGHGLGVRLFEEAAKIHPDVWITVGLDADSMIATLTSNRLNFLPIENKTNIESLFRATNQGRKHFKVEVESKRSPFLSERLERKGIRQDAFMAYTRDGATHTTYYPQIVFQNQT